MKRHRLLIPLTALTFVLAACGGGSPTQGPGGATTDPGFRDGWGWRRGDVPQAAARPVPDRAAVAGTGGGTGHIQMEIGGPVQATGDEPASSPIGERIRRRGGHDR